MKAKPPQSDEVHVSAAVDLGDIVVQAASALRINRGIVRANPVRADPNPVRAELNPVRAELNPVWAEPNPVRAEPNPVRAEPNPVRAEPVEAPAKQTVFTRVKPAFGNPRKSVFNDDSAKRCERKPWEKSAPDPEKLTPQHAYLRAIALLTGRDYSQKKICEKLAKLGFAPDTIGEALARLLGEGSLSDVRFAASRTNGLINRGKGPRPIRAKLVEAGVAKELIATALGELQIDWAARAKELLLRKFGPDPPPDRLNWAKRARFLAARGFDESAVRAALARVTR